LDRKLNEDFKNVLKTAIFFLQVDLTSNFALDCQTVKLCSKVAKLRIYKYFLAVFNTKRVSEIHDTYFDCGHVTA